jgi:hypothetical protein
MPFVQLLCGPRHVDTAPEKVDVLLRDEKEYIGILRSYDQFGKIPALLPPTLLIEFSEPGTH